MVSRKPGPMCTTKGDYIDSGTMSRNLSPLPGPLRTERTDQTNVFEIGKTTGKARRLTEGEVRAGYHGADLTTRLGSKAYFFLRAGRLVPTSLDTVNKINDPSQNTPLAAFAVIKLQNDAQSLRGSFPDGYYASFAKALFEKAISYNTARPDDGVELAGNTFGFEVGERPETLPVYHIYDSIARLDDDNGYDKVQHFVRSAYSQYNYGMTVTDISQYGKEIRDEIKSWFTGGQGFDSKDMLANNRGQALGKELYTKYHPIRDYLLNLD